MFCDYYSVFAEWFLVVFGNKSFKKKMKRYVKDVSEYELKLNFWFGLVFFLNCFWTFNPLPGLKRVFRCEYQIIIIHIICNHCKHLYFCSFFIISIFLSTLLKFLININRFCVLFQMIGFFCTIIISTKIPYFN